MKIIYHNDTMRNIESNWYAGSSELVSSLIQRNKNRCAGVKTVMVDAGYGAYLACHKYGHGDKKVIFLKGQGADSVSKEGLTQKYDGDEWTVFGIDTRGTGQSSPSMLYNAHGVNMNSMIGDIRIVADALIGKGESFSIHGASTGASTAVEFAKTHRDRVENVILEVPFFSTDPEFANGFLQEGGLAQACEDAGYGFLFKKYLSSFKKANRGNWQYMAEKSYRKIHEGDMNFIGDFIKAHAVGTIGPENISTMIKKVNKGIKYTPKYMALHAVTLSHFMAKGGFVGSNGVLDGIESIQDKLHIVAGEKDVIANPDLVVKPLIQTLNLPKTRAVIATGANHSDWKSLNPNIRLITDNLALV